jgi:8-oxo-dGTP diphosphatase
MSPETIVVGVAVIDGGRVLAARRVHPPSAAGRWELPGGKAEPGESWEDCAVREIREELGCSVRVRSLLEPRVPVKPGYTLCVVVASLEHGEPIPHEHDALRWLAGDELHKVDWLEPDLPFLPLIKEALG